MVKLVTLGLCVGTAMAGETHYFRRGPPTPDLPLDDPLLRPSTFIEQVHVTGGRADAAIITWITNTTSHGTVKVCRTAAHPYCRTFMPKHHALSYLLDPPSYYPGESPCTGPSNYTNPDCYYTSGVVHSAAIRGFLEPATAYTYTFSDDTADQSFGFTTPPAKGADVPLTFAVVGDLGQTGNSSATVDGIYAHAVGDDKVCVCVCACVCVCGRAESERVCMCVCVCLLPRCCQPVVLTLIRILLADQAGRQPHGSLIRDCYMC